MLAATKIKEGLFVISWDNLKTYQATRYIGGRASAPNILGHLHSQRRQMMMPSLQTQLQTSTNGMISVQVNVENLQEIFRSCKLNYNIEEEGNHGVLEMETVVSKGMGPGKLETIFVQAIKSDVQQTMTLMQSTWTTRWNNCAWKPSCGCYDSNPLIACSSSSGYCHYCRKPLEMDGPFFICIDLKSGSSPQKGSQHVLDHLLNLWKTKTLSDVTFKCKNKPIEAHTLILASGSPVLAAMFQHNFKENQKKVVEIQDTEANVFEELLRFIYTGNFSINNVNVAQILVAADKYAVETLKEECAMHLATNLTVANALRYLVLSHLHNSPVLYKRALSFITRKENAKVICSRKDWMEVIKNYPELCFQITQLITGD